ncbi:MAG: aminopeptidase P family protein, partial [Planctomycetales bacterium]|nr:aminopeptidase P family protein [Planctomycetales bacterium]
MANCKATLLAGIPLENPALFHRVRFGVGDPAAWISIEKAGQSTTTFVVRDIEVARARKAVSADQVAAPAEFAPAGGLSGDRATATAQAVAECLRRAEVSCVTTDRTLPYIYAWHIQQAGIAVEYSPELGVSQRRCKDEQELGWLLEAQQVTEAAMLMALETVAGAVANAEGTLMVESQALTSEGLRHRISAYLLERGYSNPHDSIVATTPHSADCHERGSGFLRTGQPVIIDIFPQCNATRYWGDCTRTVVHGDASDELRKMHAAVLTAFGAACDKAVAGATADEVHGATKQALESLGFRFARGEISDLPVMPHGTGHGIGLEVHEPILLDDQGGTLMANEVFTIE